MAGAALVAQFAKGGATDDSEASDQSDSDALLASATAAAAARPAGPGSHRTADGRGGAGSGESGNESGGEVRREGETWGSRLQRCMLRSRLKPRPLHCPPSTAGIPVPFTHPHTNANTNTDTKTNTNTTTNNIPIPILKLRGAAVQGPARKGERRRVRGGASGSRASGPLKCTSMSSMPNPSSIR